MKRWYFLVVLLFLFTTVVLAFSQIKHLVFQVRVSDYYPQNQKIISNFNDFKKKFPNQKEKLIVMLKPNERVYHFNFLDRLNTFQEFIDSLETVDRVSSILNAKRPVPMPIGIHFSDFLKLEKPKRFSSDSIQITKNHFITNNYISKNHDYVCLLVDFDSIASKIAKKTVIQKIKRKAETLNFDQTYLLGKEFTEILFTDIMGKELKSLGIALISLMALALIFLYRNLWLVLFLLLMVAVNLIIVYGIFGFIGFRLELLSNILPVLIIVTCVNNGIHLIHAFQIQSGLNTQKALKNTFSKKGKDVLIANLTTSLGFALLYFSELKAIQNFALLSACSLLITFISSSLCLYLILSLASRYRFLRNYDKTNDWITQKILMSYQYADHNKVYYVGTLLGFVFLGIGSAFLDYNNKMITNIPEEQGLKKSMSIYEKEFGGYRSIEVLIKSKNGTFSSLDNLEAALDSADKVLNTKSGIRQTQSINQLASYITSNDIKLSEKQFQYNAYKMGFLDKKMQEARVVIRMDDIGRLKNQTIREQLLSSMRHFLSKEDYEIIFTGTDYLTDMAHKYRVEEMLTGLLLSSLLVSTIILLFFRRLSYFLVSILANILPLFLVAGLMGWIGIELRGATSILFTIGFAIAVDDTIHLIASYKRQKENKVNTITNALKEAGSPIVVSSFVFVLGFAVMCFSSLWDLQMFGVIVSAFVIFALFTDIFLVPIVLLKLKINE